MKKLDRSFYSQDALLVAEELLGKILVRELDGVRTSARIVETEAYRGTDDKAAHFYGGRRTERTEVIYGAPGHAYVYLIYGMHCLFNIVTAPAEMPQAVLVRALEPVEGEDLMAIRRFKKPLAALTKQQRLSLTNGPGKLSAAMAIDRSLYGEDLCGSRLYVEDEGDKARSFSVVKAKRIGIDYAEEAIHFPWRFYIENNPYVSVKNGH